MDLTASLAVGVPLVSGLAFVAFQHPGIYRKHFQGRMFVLPWVLLGIYAVVSLSYSWGAVAQYAVDNPAPGTAGAAWFPIPPWFALGWCGALQILAVALYYLAQISPHADHKP